MGLDESASDDEIKSVCKKLARMFNPKTHPDDTEFYNNIFTYISKVYATLSNQEKRDEYDTIINAKNYNNEIVDYVDFPIGARVALENIQDKRGKENLKNYVEEFIKRDGGRSNEELIEKDAVVNGENGDKGKKGFDWDPIFTDWIFNIKTEEKVGNSIKIVAMIESISGPTPFVLKGGKRETVYNITLLDHRGDKIECLTIPHKSFKDEIAHILETKAYHVFCGTVISIAGKKPTYKFFLQEIFLTITPEDLFRVRLDPKNLVPKKFLEITKLGSRTLITFIKNTIIDQIGIKGLDSAKKLSKCIDFMILQGFSHGKDDKNSHRLHSLVIGSPGVGKKLLTITAKILNPITEEISSVSGKISMAGMIGDVSIKKGRRISNPGYFAKASSGVLCVQDFHEVKGATRQQFLSLLSKVMEDGEVIDSTSARTTHEAVTAIHLDTNLPSQVQMIEEPNPLKDINIPTNILSRFDFIMNIPRDVQRQYEVTKEMIGGDKVIESYGKSNIEEQWKREIRRFVAYARTAYHYVEIKGDVPEYILEKLDQIKKDAEKTFEDPLLLADIITRLGMSIQKYVKAITSANLRYDATKEDVDYALEFIQEKLSYLSQIGKEKTPAVKKFTHKLKYAERIKLLSSIYGDKIIDSKSIFEIYDRHGVKVSRTTIHRDRGKYNKIILKPKISFSKSTVAKFTK